MKNVIKNLIPISIIQLYKKWGILKFRNLDTKDVFTEIYKTNHWNSEESISGGGSELSQTKSLLRDLGLLLKEKKIHSVLDLPCGDFKWMQHLDFTDINYIGGDIVEELIQLNSLQYKNLDNVNFRLLDLIEDTLPKSDLIIVRDCLVHLSNSNIFKAINNIKRSGSTDLLTTTFPDFNLNYDIVTGDWRRLNLEKEPFNFPLPLLVINENCTEKNGEYKDKSMALWLISEI